MASELRGEVSELSASLDVALAAVDWREARDRRVGVSTKPGCSVFLQDG